jgi:hypothetical protein
MNLREEGRLRSIKKKKESLYSTQQRLQLILNEAEKAYQTVSSVRHAVISPAKFLESYPERNESRILEIWQSPS